MNNDLVIEYFIWCLFTYHSGSIWNLKMLVAGKLEYRVIPGKKPCGARSKALTWPCL